MLQKSSFLKRHLCAVITATVFMVLGGGGLCLLFFLDWVKYPKDENALEYCYSPNHEYYITRWQSPWASYTDEMFVRGTAKLYDKTGKLLYSNKTDLSFEFGPWWIDDPAGRRSSVVYQGTEKPGWGYNLPSSPGHDYSGPSRKCY